VTKALVSFAALFAAALSVGGASAQEAGKCQGARVWEFDGVSVRQVCRQWPTTVRRDVHAKAVVFGPYLRSQYEWERMAYVAPPSNRECVILSCPQFLLTGVGY